MIYKIHRWFALASILLITSCSTYHHVDQTTLANFKTLSPQYVASRQGQIEYYRYGHGSPIVLIPGYATDVTSWNRYFLATLAAKHQIILINNRGVAGSRTRSRAYFSQDLANDTYLLMTSLHLQKPAVVGISMGGMIAQQLAVLHQDALGQLILINTSIAGKNAIHPDPATEKKLTHIPNNQLGFYASAVDMFFPVQWKASMAYSLAADRFLPRNRIDINASNVTPQQRRLVYEWLDNNAAAKQIVKLHLPVLILNGESDVVIPPKNSVILAEKIPHAKLVRWKEGGHAMIYQYPEELGNEINKFIAQYPVR